MVSINSNFSSYGYGNYRNYSSNKSKNTQKKENDTLKPDNTVKGRIIITHNRDGSTTYHYNGVDDGKIDIISLDGRRNIYTSGKLHAQYREAIEKYGKDGTYTGKDNPINF